MQHLADNLFSGIDHVVWIVSDLNTAIDNWQMRLGVSLTHQIEQPEQGVQQAFFSLADGTFIELLAPSSEDSPIAQLIEDHGEGIHVLAMRVQNLDHAVQTLKIAGVRLIGTGTSQIFIHPKDAGGTMLQLWPQDRLHRWRDSKASGSTLS